MRWEFGGAVSVSEIFMSIQAPFPQFFEVSENKPVWAQYCPVILKIDVYIDVGSRCSRFIHRFARKGQANRIRC